MKDHTVKSIALYLLGRLLNRAHRMFVSNAPALSNALSREVDVFQMIFVFERRRLETYDVHARQAAIGDQILHCLVVLFFFGQMGSQFLNDMPQLMNLFLTGDMRRVAA